MIGSPGAYLSRNRRVIMCLITGVRFELFAIGYPGDFHVNYVHFDGFLCNVFYSFKTYFIRTTPRDVFAQKKFLEDIFNSEICYRHD